jgi:transposase
MSSRGPYRRHSPQFRLQLCQDIRSGAIGRRDAARHHNLSTNLLQLWLTQYDRGELSTEEAEASIVAEYEARIAALERKVGQLTMELDLAKKTPRLRLVSDNESSSIITGPPSLFHPKGVSNDRVAAQHLLLPSSGLCHADGQ